MKVRYTTYFLSHILALKDELATYYVQDRFFDRKPALGVELKKFPNHAAAVRWLKGCAADDNCAIHNIRHFMAEHGPINYPLHLMDDHEVLDDVARIIVNEGYAVIIHPEFEPPERASSTIDTLCAIEQGAPLTDLGNSEALAQANRELRHAVDKSAKNEVDNYGAATPKPQNRQIALAAQHADLRFHNENNWGPTNPDAAKKVLLNAIKLLTMTAPETINSHPLDQLITEAVDDFIKTTKGAWPPPVDAEQLLADHMKKWILKKERVRKRPAIGAAAASRRPPNQKKPKAEPNFWIEIQMTQKDGSPLEGEAFTITTADGKTFNGMTDSEGVGSVTGIKQGNCKMEFPNMDKDMWGPQGSAAIGKISNRSGGSTQYKIKPGDTLASIAEESGTPWKLIWDHPDNAELKEKYKEPTVLMEGDVLHIPEKESKQEKGGTSKRHMFETAVEPLEEVTLGINLRINPDTVSESNDCVVLQHKDSQWRQSVKISDQDTVNDDWVTLNFSNFPQSGNYDLLYSAEYEEYSYIMFEDTPLDELKKFEADD